MRISDHRFVRRLVLIAMAISLVMAACSSDDPADTTTAAPTTTAAGSDTTAGGSDTTAPTTPPTTAASGGDVKNAGLYVHAADDEPLSLDPAGVAAGEAGETVILQVYDRLVEIGPGGPDLVPGLSTEVPTADNGLIWAMARGPRSRPRCRRRWSRPWTSQKTTSA